MSNQDGTFGSGAQGSGAQNNKVRLDLEQRKVVVSASLISVLIAVMVANQTLLKKKDSGDGQARTIANVSRFVKVDQGQLEWQKKLAQELSESNGKRELASLGRPPNAFDQLRFGFFEGKYAFQLEHGKIKEINFVDSGQTSDRPKYIENVSKFLNQHHELFSVAYSHAEKGGSESHAGFKIESYNLYKNSKVVGWAKVSVDEHGRAHALKFLEKEDE